MKISYRKVSLFNNVVIIVIMKVVIVIMKTFLVKNGKKREIRGCTYISSNYSLGLPVFTTSAHQPTVVLNTARDILDTNQTHQRVVTHNLTQVMTCCCPVKTHVN